MKNKIYLLFSAIIFISSAHHANAHDRSVKNCGTLTSWDETQKIHIVLNDKIYPNSPVVAVVCNSESQCSPVAATKEDGTLIILQRDNKNIEIQTDGQKISNINFHKLIKFKNISKYENNEKIISYNADICRHNEMINIK